MKDICFFPFTHITDDQEKTLDAFFPEVKVLSLGAAPPAGSGREGSCLAACCLPEDQAALLASQLAAYLSWAEIHKGNEKNLKHLLRETPYFKTETDLTSIKSQIRGSISPGDPGPEKGQAPDPGLFLKLAQVLDAENEAIEARLKALDKGKEALLAELKGEIGEEDSALSGVRGSDQGEIMPGERIRAWASIARQAGLFTDAPPLLVTTSPGIMAYLTDKADEVINGLDIDSIKVHENECRNKAAWFQSVDKLLDQTISDPHENRGDALPEEGRCCRLSGRMKLCLFPGGELNDRLNIPGRQLSVCLVGLNS